MLDNSPRDKILLFSVSSVAWLCWWGAIEPKFIHRSIAWHCWTSSAVCNPLCIKGMLTRHTLRIPRRTRFLSNFPLRSIIHGCTNTAQYCHGGDLVHALYVCLGQAQSQNTSHCREAVYNHWTGLVDWSGGTKSFSFFCLLMRLTCL